MLKKVIMLLSALVFVFAIGLGGCSDDDNKTPTPGSDATVGSDATNVGSDATNVGSDATNVGSDATGGSDATAGSDATTGSDAT